MTGNWIFNLQQRLQEEYPGFNISFLDTDGPKKIGAVNHSTGERFCVPSEAYDEASTRDAIPLLIEQIKGARKAHVG